MFGKFNIFGYLLILPQLSYQVLLESQSSDYYTAAVVEYSSIYIKNDAKSTLIKNAEAFVNYIEQASKQNADIIVFPEYALTSIFMPPNANPFIWSTIVPSSLEGYIPCIESKISGIQEAVKRISCAARDNRIYVVINLIEKQFNKKNGTWHYHNTNIVFDRTGKIIARYRKTNLYLEGNLESPVPSDLVTFDTDFGVKFGVIICFDMLFKEPALNLTRIEGVSNIVYSTAWLSSVPFLIAAQYQYGWAYAENVNLLAAGYNKPEFSFLGSGIYSGRNGILNTTMSSNPKNRLLISRLPKTPRKTKSISKWLKIEKKMKTMERKTIHEETFDLHNKPVTEDIDSILISHDNITWFNSVLLNDSMTRNICYNDFCCDFVIRTKIVDPSTYYRAVVYKGIRQFDVVVDANVRHCAVIQCSNESLASCYSINTSETTFSTLSVTARFDDYQDIQVLPSSLNSSLLPFEQWSFDEQTFGKQTKVIITLNKPTRNILTFGLYARIFSEDIKH